MSAPPPLPRRNTASGGPPPAASASYQQQATYEAPPQSNSMKRTSSMSSQHSAASYEEPQEETYACVAEAMMQMKIAATERATKQGLEEHRETPLSEEWWYKPDFDRLHAEQFLQRLGFQEGYFCVRGTQKHGGIYVISHVVLGLPKHTIVLLSANGAVEVDENVNFPNIQELIKFYQTHKVAGGHLTKEPPIISDSIYGQAPEDTYETMTPSDFRHGVPGATEVAGVLGGPVGGGGPTRAPSLAKRRAPAPPP